MHCWRLTPAAAAGTAFTGAEAGRIGGRWNRPGRPAVYLSVHLATATLELLANAEGADVRAPMAAIEVEIPDHLLLVLTAAQLPACWRDEPVPSACQDFGDRHLRGPHLGLVLPCSLLPAECNVVLDPGHPDAGLVRHLRRLDFVLDERLACPRWAAPPGERADARPDHG